jgi:ABC-type transporter Mla maintaining outer membrane lipid asymmetry permease subunit MlaE
MKRYEVGMVLRAKQAYIFNRYGAEATVTAVQSVITSRKFGSVVTFVEMTTSNGTRLDWRQSQVTAHYAIASRS